MSITKRRFLATSAAAAGLAKIGTPAVLRAQSAPLRFGVTGPSTGPMAFKGNSIMSGIKLAALQYNKDGGLLGRPIELVFRDDKFSAAGAVAAAREFSGMGISLHIGGVFTPSTLAVLPLLDELKAVFVAMSSFTLSITHEHYSRYAFRPAPNNYIVSRSLASSVLQRYKDVNRWQTVITDNAFGRDAAKIFSLALREFFPKVYGAGKQPEILEPMVVSATQTDFRLQINQLMNSGVEGIYLVVPGAPGIAFYQQAKQLGLEKKYKVILDIQDDSVAQALGGAIPDNLWTFSMWPYQSDPVKGNAENQRCLADYAAMTGEKFPPSGAMYGYRAARTMFEGVKKAKSTERDAVVAGIEDTNFTCLGDPFTIRKEDHQGLGTGYHGRVVASKDAPGWAFTDVVRIDDSSVVEPPSPGKEFTP